MGKMIEIQSNDSCGYNGEGFCKYHGANYDLKCTLGGILFPANCPLKNAEPEKGDSTLKTVEHIQRVQYFLQIVIEDLLKKSRLHDNTKLKSPEKEVFDEYTAKLKDTVYMSKEYLKYKKEMQPALDLHYAECTHHPEHYKNGVNGMTLMDLLELCCDWKASSERNKNGDVMQSIKDNTKRFDLSPQLVDILKNTVTYFSFHG